MRTPAVNGITNVAESRSDTAKLIMYRFVVVRSRGFLYTAKHTKRFPVSDTIFMSRQTPVSAIVTTCPWSGISVPEFFSSLAKVMPLVFLEITMKEKVNKNGRLLDQIFLGFSNVTFIHGLSVFELWQQWRKLALDKCSITSNLYSTLAVKCLQNHFLIFQVLTVEWFLLKYHSDWNQIGESALQTSSSSEQRRFSVQFLGADRKSPQRLKLILSVTVQTQVQGDILTVVGTTCFQEMKTRKHACHKNWNTSR